jgi:NAD(P)-dependent dehydrogenase (short-subunit alcohol dehydrogenase family)
LPRFVLTAAKLPVTTVVPRKLPAGVMLITDDGRGISSRVASELRRRGCPVALVWPPEFAALPEQDNSRFAADTFCADLSDAAQVAGLVENLRTRHGRVAGILHLLPLRDWGGLPWQRRLALETKGLFQLAKAAGSELRLAGQPQAILLAATALGGDFGVTPGSGRGLSPVQGGVAGLVKTLALEWPDVACRVIDFEAGLDAASTADRLLTALSGDGPVETGYQGDGWIRLEITPAPLGDNRRTDALLGEDPVLLITGGARGITAKAAIAIASKYRGHILIVGKSPMPPVDEPPETAGVESPRQLKATLIEQARRSGGTAVPAAIEAGYARLLCDREIRENLGRLRATGAEVRYLQCDLTSAEEFGRLLNEVYSTYGKIDGVIHGAGVIEDRLVEDKDPGSFDRVIGAKVTGAMVLAERLRPDSLRFLAFFSSVSGRFGNRGQADYAAANDVLNKLAAHLDAIWPARVVAINWGPWDGSNMVGDAVRQQFVRRGVQLIDAAAGSDALIQELLSGRKGQAEVILGGGPWGETAADPVSSRRNAVAAGEDLPLLGEEPLVAAPGGAVRTVVRLDPSQHRFLEDHCLDGKPVLPGAMAIELMAETARKGWPDYVVTSVKSVRVCKGIVLDGATRQVCVSGRPQTHHNAEDHGLAVDIDISDPERPAASYYRGTVCLADRLPPAPPRDFSRDAEFGSSDMSVSEAYGSRLFHGPRFQCLKRIWGLNGHGIRARITPSRPSECIELERQCSWIIDPVLLDAGPQLLILWAQEMRGMTALPSRFGEVRIFDGLREALLAGAAEPLECRLMVGETVDGPIITATYEVFGPGGETVLCVEGLESTGSESLNRLAVGAPTARS